MRFFHSGDLGDIIYALPSIRALLPEGEKGELFLGQRDWTRSVWSESLFETIAPLLRLQSYLSKVVRLGRNEIPEHPFVDFSTFRNGGYQLGDTIFERQRRWVNARARYDEPWLSVEPDKSFGGSIVVNRSDRWQGFVFPWREIVRAYSDRMIFIGLPGEHRFFEREFGAVPFERTQDLLAAARSIAGAAFFIGNQSALNALANALHCPSLVEVAPYACDCFLPRENTGYCLDGALSLRLFGRSLVLPPGDLLGLDELEMQFLEKARRALALQLKKRAIGFP